MSTPELQQRDITDSLPVDSTMISLQPAGHHVRVLSKSGSALSAATVLNPMTQHTCVAGRGAHATLPVEASEPGLARESKASSVEEA